MPIDLRKKLGTDDPKWDKVKSGFKKVETGTWKALAPVGNWGNRQAGKLGAESFWPTELGLECDKAARILRTFTSKGATVEVDANNTAAINDQDAVVPAPAPKYDEKGKKIKDPHKYDHRKTQKVIRRIPPKALQQAQGLAIFTVFRTGFGLSGASGSGVVISRLPDGSWSPPSGILIHTIGYGFLIGLDIYDVVLVLRNRKAVDAFKHPKISLGGELSVACGPVGNGAQLDTSVNSAPCWSYTKSKGLYAGLQLDGTAVLKRDDENHRFYKNPSLSVEQILSGQLQEPPPFAVLPLWQTIYAAEGRPELMGVDRIPEGTTPGDLELSKEEMNAQQEKHQQEQQGTPSAPVGSISSRQLPPAPGSSQDASGSQAYSDLPPDYEFANAPVNAQGGKEFNDSHIPAGDTPPDPLAKASVTPDHASHYESAEQEKARLQQQYNNAAAGAGTGTTASSAAEASAGATLPARVEAVYDFDGQEEGDLSFKIGAVIEVTGKEDDMWWHGTVAGRSGIFPSNYTRAL